MAATSKIDERETTERAEVSEAPLRPKRQRRPFVIAAGIVAAAAVGYASYAHVTAGKESTDDAQVAADTVPITARVGGPVARVVVSDHQVVKAGDVLVEISDTELAARLRQAEAEVLAAKAQAAAADAQVGIVEATSRGGLLAARAALSGSSASASGAQAQIDAARAALMRAEADRQKAESDLARANALRRDEAIPQSQLESAQASANVARAAVAQAQANLAVAEESRRLAASRTAEAKGRVEQSSPIDAQLASAKAGAELARARAAAAEAALDLARIQLSHTKIVAPTGGAVAKLAVRSGQTIQTGQLVTYLVPRSTYVVANFKETQIGRMKPGQRATITVDAYPGRKLTARIGAISPGTGAQFSLLPPDNASGNFVKVVQRVPVRLVWSEGEDADLQAGLSVEVTVETR